MSEKTSFQLTKEQAQYCFEVVRLHGVKLALNSLLTARDLEDDEIDARVNELNLNDATLDSLKAQLEAAA